MAYMNDKQVLLAALKGDKGDKGDMPIKGVDYFTEDDKKELVEEVAVMTKSSFFVPNTISGEIVFADDVSGANHELEISVTGAADPTTVTVKQYKRNLLPTSYLHVPAMNNNTFTTNGAKFQASNDGHLEVLSDTSTNSIPQFRIVYGGVDGAGNVFYLPPGTYTKSVIVKDISAGTSATDYNMFFNITRLNSNGTTSTVNIGKNAPTFDIVDGDVINYITVAIPNGKNVAGVKLYPMLERGDTQSGWEGVKEPNQYTPNPDGSVTRVMSISPAMTLMTNTPGATISCTYDTNEIVIAGGDEETPTSKKWAGKTWVCVGDSMTEANSYTDVHYFDYISSDTGIGVVNMGDSGTGYAKGSPNNDVNTTFRSRIAAANLTDADVITIMGGVNDPGAHVELGTTSAEMRAKIGTPSDNDTTTLCGCVNATIDAVHAAEIARGKPLPFGIIASPPAWSQPPTDSTNFVTEYYGKIAEICRFRGVPFLDLYHCSGLRPWEDEYKLLAYTKDSKDSDGNLHGLHPDERGHEIIASKIKAFLETLLL